MYVLEKLETISEVHDRPRQALSDEPTLNNGGRTGESTCRNCLVSNYELGSS